ncbi:GIY-YIG nuclease family protein [Streptomyces sp. NPDC015125]|uniref:GIY-YIG nuclease family protein n=1 Tax=Streptomyces sp. NPDC015125 TaxID=3364938 RepID=UPI0036FCFF15
MKHADRTALYRLYAKRKRLLYIGISRNPDVRWGQHSLTKDWWHEVERREVEWFDTRKEAEEAERQAIKSEDPRWNTQHRTAPLAPPRFGAPADHLKVFATYKQALEERRALEPKIKEIAVRALRRGASVNQLSSLTGLTPEVFRRIRDAHDIPVDPRYQSRAELARARKAAVSKDDA